MNKLLLVAAITAAMAISGAKAAFAQADPDVVTFDRAALVGCFVNPDANADSCLPFFATPVSGPHSAPTGGTLYFEKGLDFTSSIPGDLVAIVSRGKNANPNLGIVGADPVPGGNTLLEAGGDGIVTITRFGGGVFTLVSLDLAKVFENASSLIIPYAWVDGGGTHSGVFDLGDSEDIALETFTLNLAGITSFSITQGDFFNNNYFQLDNVDRVFVDQISAGAPEASTWMLMILGLGGAGVMVRRHRGPVAVA